MNKKKTISGMPLIIARYPFPEARTIFKDDLAAVAPANPNAIANGAAKESKPITTKNE
jgi:hypothetical protein